MERIRHVVVVGGGSAGWLAACHLARRLRPATNPQVSVTLIESPDIPIIGVGEGTVPAMRAALQDLGLRETDLIRECEATFKQGIEFVDWMKPGADGRPHAYQHLFDPPIPNGFDLTPYWLQGALPEQTGFAAAVTPQAALCAAGRGPKSITTPEYQAQAQYAYHFDAGLFAQLLQRHATTALGVRHLQARVQTLRYAENGDIAALQTDTAGEITGELFIDCTGFTARLINAHNDSPWTDLSEVLLVDTALAVRVPYDRPDAPIAPVTRALARDAGWIWDIGLQTRRGIGYVYSSRYRSEEAAFKVLRDYIGPTLDALSPRSIPMRVGYRARSWQRNCVAIGLSQGFVEPLEATALMLTTAACRMVADCLPATRATMDAEAERYNALMQHGWEQIVDFIKLHYCISDRDDTAFWRDNRRWDTLSPALQRRLTVWRERTPNAYDFFGRYDVFHLENYLYVLYGMDYATQVDESALGESSRARDLNASIQRLARQRLDELPEHRALIEKIREYGLQRC